MEADVDDGSSNKNPTPNPRLLTAAQTADVLAISRSKVYLLMAAGELKPIHIGRSTRILHDDVIDFIRQRRDPR